MDKPLYSEEWFRVSSLQPSLRNSVSIYRHNYRGRLRYLIQDGISMEQYMVDEFSYQIIARFDGRKNLGEIWDHSLELLGDNCPGQVETIELMGQLFSNHLIKDSFALNSDEIFEQGRQQTDAQVGNSLKSFFFQRIPLWDPEAFVQSLKPFYGLLFSTKAMWLTVLYFLFAFFQFVSHAELDRPLDTFLSAENLLYFYICSFVLKFSHEIAHACACKKMAEDEGVNAEVHQMGLMFVVFLPFPYVNASAANILRSKWRRMIVASAGVYIELLAAATALFLWLHTSPGSLINVLAFNIILSAGFSNLIFNLNPFLKYDGYYILADYLELPNLSNNSRKYVYFLCKRLFLGQKNEFEQDLTAREKKYFVAYYFLSIFFRFLILSGIIATLIAMYGDVSKELVGLLAIQVILIPAFMLLKYFMSSPECEGKRLRACILLSLCFVLLAGPFAYMKVEDWEYMSSRVSLDKHEGFYLRDSARLKYLRKNGEQVAAGEALILLENPSLQFRLAEIAEQKKKYTIESSRSQIEGEHALSLVYEKKIDLLIQQEDHLESEIAEMKIMAPYEGRFFHSNLEGHRDDWLRAGTFLGRLECMDEVFLEVTVPQDSSSFANNFKDKQVEFILPGGSEHSWRGIVKDIYSRKSNSKEKVHEDLFLKVKSAELNQFYTGTKLTTRISLGKKPLYEKYWRRFKLMIQKKFKV